MSNRYIQYISGNEYCLQDLFGGDTKIIIPDLQRDYCWGDSSYSSNKDKKPHELVFVFVKNMIELLEDDNWNRDTTLGLIYGYEQPYNHIYICDGQQRLTTLFLLIGYINIKTNGKFNKYIISEKEMEDDFEPHLLYAIRESTLYFLSDLALHVFIERTTEIADIKSSNWYFNEYDQDTSIQSMIAALNTIHGILNGYDSVGIEKFGDYVMNHLHVLYYDMENRSRGEETYIVINTTGEPLSTPENIKPILLGTANLTEEERKRYADQWEDREGWFWQNRGNDVTADNGMQVFFMWYWQIGLIQESRWIDDKKYPLSTRELFLHEPKKMQESSNEATINLENYNTFRSLDNLEKYFQALKNLVDKICKNQDLQNVLLTVKKDFESTQLDNCSEVWNFLRNIDLDVILPLLCFMAEQQQENQMLGTFVRRIRQNHFDGVWSKTANNNLSRRGEKYLDWRYIIQLIRQERNGCLLTVDIHQLKITKIPNISINTWFNDNEKIKNILKSHSLSTDKMEDHEVLMGDLTPLWQGFSNIEENISNIQYRWNMLERICKSLDPEEAQKDIQFSNWFRLYRLIYGIIPIEHISYCRWDYEGCFYSRRQKTPWWIENINIRQLLDANNPVKLMKERIKKKVTTYLNKPRNHQELLMSWLTIKTLQADQGRYLINIKNDRAIASFIELNKNYIMSSNEFHWGNIICGYAWRDNIYPASDEGSWNIKENLNTPLYAIPFIPNFNNRPDNAIDSDMVNKGDLEIQQLINDFLS